MYGSGVAFACGSGRGGAVDLSIAASVVRETIAALVVRSVNSRGSESESKSACLSLRDSSQ